MGPLFLLLSAVAWRSAVGQEVEMATARKTRVALAAIEAARCSGGEERRRFRDSLTGFKTPQLPAHFEKAAP